MTSREQFEAKCRNGLINGGLAKHENGKYASELTDAVWRGWQASREEMEVELPAACADDEYFNDGVFQPMRYERDVERAIRASGLKVIEGEKKNG